MWNAVAAARFPPALEPEGSIKHVFMVSSQFEFIVRSEEGVVIQKWFIKKKETIICL